VGNTKQLAYIDALRGFAILGVIAVHAGNAVPDLEWAIRTLTDQGARGVQLFFVVSALTLMFSWRERNDGALPFYVRRIFRIVPMFYLWTILSIAVSVFEFPPDYWPHGEISWQNVLRSITFSFAFHPTTVDGIVPGGWSIADEMTFYLVLPVLILVLRSWTTTVWALLAATCASIILAVLANFGWLFPELDRDLVKHFVFLSFPNHLPAFLAGILVFHLLCSFPGTVPHNTLRVGLAVSFISIAAIPFIAVVARSFMPSVPTNYLMPLAYALPFALCTWCLAKGERRFMVNRVTKYIGKVSYSAYFWHFPVLGLLSHSVFSLFASTMPGWVHFMLIFSVATVLTIAISAITYRFVEAPMISLGRQLAKMLTREPFVVDQPRTISQGEYDR
jgi:exopolysaccharide production protein ExoZ